MLVPKENLYEKIVAAGLNLNPRLAREENYKLLELITKGRLTTGMANILSEGKAIKISELLNQSEKYAHSYFYGSFYWPEVVSVHSSKEHERLVIAKINNTFVISCGPRWETKVLTFKKHTDNVYTNKFRLDQKLPADTRKWNPVLLDSIMSRQVSNIKYKMSFPANESPSNKLVQLRRLNIEPSNKQMKEIKKIYIKRKLSNDIIIDPKYSNY